MTPKEQPKMNLWHELVPGTKVPEVLYAVIEIAKGSRNKYEYSKTGGVFKLDRVLYSPFVYPAEYGFVPQTYFDDGDPLDILVMMNEPTFVGCVIECRPLGMLRMVDSGEPDSKILAVPADDPYFKHYASLKDVSPHFLREVEHFFQAYKTLQGKVCTTEGWADLEETQDVIRRSVEAYRAKFPSVRAGVEL
jgi:inorganic pyrophosphatase